MANFVRFAKSANDWSAYDVIAYNITFSPVAPDEFFPSASAGADISLDHLDPAILTALPGANDDSLSDEVVEYLNYLDFAVRDLQDGDVTQFARETLRLLGFKARNILIPTRYSISYTICGDPSQSADMPVCLMCFPILVLLVFLKENILSKMPNAEFGVVAGAIAAFQSNNTTREEAGLPPLDVMTIPCITMSGTRPTFYLVPVTQELSTAVATGQYPATQTRVLKCVTVPEPEHIQRANDGMKNPEYRKLALKRFLAFKTLAKSYWDQMSSGF